MSVALVMSIFVLRAALHLQAVRRQRLMEIWRPLLLECLVGEAATTFPGLAHRDVPTFLRFRIHKGEHVLPIVPAGRGMDEAIGDVSECK